MPTFSAKLARAYADYPERVAIHLQRARQEDQPITYRALLSRAAAFAQRLAQSGVQPGEVVVIILQHGEALVHAFWGAILHGATPSILPPLTEKLLPERYRHDLAALMGLTRPAAIVTYPEFAAEIRAAIDVAVAENPALRAPVAVPVSDGDLDVVEPDFDTLPGLARSEQDVVLLQHSSGSTGLQKGVALSHRAVLNQLEAYAPAIGLSADDVIVSWLPLYHDMGLIAAFIMPVLCGAPLVLMSPFDWVRAPVRLMQAVAKYRGTLTWLPNFAYNFCATRIRDRDMEGVDLSSLRAVINCSEPVYESSHRVFMQKFQRFGLRPNALATCYAMAENTFAVTQSAIGEPVAHNESGGISRDPSPIPRVRSGTFGTGIEGRSASRIGKRDRGGNAGQTSSGRPLPNVRLRILDEQFRDVAEGAIGEIALQSDCMLSEYYHRPDATQKAFLQGQRPFEGPWYLTGDLGYMLNGELFVAGRKKDLIIVGGKNVYPQDLEQLVGDVRGVRAGRVAAFGVFDQSAGTEEVIIVAEAESDDENERERVAEVVRQHITRNSDVAVRQVVLVDSRWLVKTSSGKVARNANKEKYLELHARS